MMLAKETSTLEEEGGADEEEGREEGATGFVVAAFKGSTWGRFAVSYAALLRIDSLLMAPMT